MGLLLDFENFGEDLLRALVLCDVVKLRVQEYERLSDARMRRRWRKRAEELLAKKYR